MAGGTQPFPLETESSQNISEQVRDSIAAFADQTPAIVSISDIHGYLAEARSALLTLTNHPDYEPVVTQSADDYLHWADNNYVLLFNGDLIDRGPHNIETLQLVARLINEAPPGRVRVTLGNHEMAVLTPDLFHWDGWFCDSVGSEGRQTLFEAIQRGYVIAAYEGYSAVYAHAGHPETYDVETVNSRLVAAVGKLQDAHETLTDTQVQQAVVDEYPLVLGMGDGHLKHPPAGLVWLDFQYLSQDAPSQIVGHTRHDTVTQKGAVLCENVIRNTQGEPGGESVVIETPDQIVSLRRTADGDVTTTEHILD
ncbi:metallophosphoesterase [Halomicroarcula limicola]|uniref:Metallophosphoesterase n=1 Tax=Haloarcula limicola TaxID=1429915 RepID=A0A8J8C8M7_9EURY|nr:metallophosphoesterase [Halomicroarcula limicola]MBV0926233.1 metallophosphoesterase [Halomicroarcula limicola]